MPVIGWLDPTTADAGADRLRVFRQGLKDTGYVEGDNVAIVYRFAENQVNRLPELAADLVRREVTGIAAFASGPLPTKGATTTSPIVFIAPEHPVSLAHGSVLTRPDCHRTGIN